MNLGLPFIDYAVIGIYIILMLGIGFYFSRFMKGGKDFFVGGNLIPWWVAGVSLYMSLFSAWTFTGAASFTYNTGWYGILFFTTWPIAFAIGFLLSAKRWRRTRMTSPVEYVQTRFNKATHLFLSILYGLSMAYWPAHHLASLSKICAPTLFPGSIVAIDIMIVLTGIVILIYTISGGFWAVCITDVVQFLILMCICIVLIPTCFLSGELGSIGEFFSKVPPLEFSHVIRGNTVYNHWYLIGFVAANIFGYAVGEKAQRFYSVKDEKAAMRVGWVTLGLFMTGPIIFGLPPLIGKVLWPDINTMTYFSGITKPDENIYIAVVLRYMPAGVIGIFLSAMMSASMSAMDSVWNSVSAIVSVDIYKSIFRPKASEQEVLRVGRITIVALSIIAVILALIIIHSEYGVFTFTNIFFGLAGVPVAIPLFLGIMCRNITRWSAMSSILAGTLVASVARFALHYSLGPQYLLIVAITLFYVFSSNPFGKLYLRNRFYALGLSLLIGCGLWVYFMTANNNPDLSFVTMMDVLTSGLGKIISSTHFWVTVSALTFAGLLYKFAALNAKDVQTPSQNVKLFFEKMNTPIDVEQEVFAKSGSKEVNVFPLVGGIAILLSGLSLLLLIAPVARAKIGVNLAISGFLFSIGLIMLLSKNQRH